MRNMSRRKLLALAPLGIVGGCTRLVEQSPYYSLLASPFRKAKSPITRSYVEQLPYASLRVQPAGGAAALLVLGKVSPEGALTWLSAERQSLTTKGPFVTQLVGLDVDLRDAFSEFPPRPDLEALAGKTIDRQITYRAESDVFVRVRSRFERGDAEEIEILDRRFRTQVYREHVSANGQRRFTNIYWVDMRNGLCRQSRQTVIPTYPPFLLQVAKPYAAQ
jgi:Group 4 capsule polysaccharide lipoprotein gfcB, YjbF